MTAFINVLKNDFQVGTSRKTESKPPPSKETNDQESGSRSDSMGGLVGVCGDERRLKGSSGNAVEEEAVAGKPATTNTNPPISDKARIQHSKAAIYFSDSDDNEAFVDAVEGEAVAEESATTKAHLAISDKGRNNHSKAAIYFSDSDDNEGGAGGGGGGDGVVRGEVGGAEQRTSKGVGEISKTGGAERMASQKSVGSGPRATRRTAIYFSDSADDGDHAAKSQSGEGKTSDDVTERRKDEALPTTSTQKNDTIAPRRRTAIYFSDSDDQEEEKVMRKGGSSVNDQEMDVDMDNSKDDGQSEPSPPPTFKKRGRIAAMRQKRITSTTTPAAESDNPEEHQSRKSGSSLNDHEMDVDVSVGNYKDESESKPSPPTFRSRGRIAAMRQKRSTATTTTPPTSKRDHERTPKTAGSPNATTSKISTKDSTNDRSNPEVDDDEAERQAELARLSKYSNDDDLVFSDVGETLPHDRDRDDSSSSDDDMPLRRNISSNKKKSAVRSTPTPSAAKPAAPVASTRSSNKDDDGEEGKGSASDSDGTVDSDGNELVLRRPSKKKGKQRRSVHASQSKSKSVKERRKSDSSSLSAEDDSKTDPRKSRKQKLLGLVKGKKPAKDTDKDERESESESKENDAVAMLFDGDEEGGDRAKDEGSGSEEEGQGKNAESQSDNEKAKQPVKPKKQRAASKKALKEMHKESQRLIRETILDAPISKPKFTMDTLFAKFGIKKQDKEKRKWGDFGDGKKSASPTQDDDEEAEKGNGVALDADGDVKNGNEDGSRDDVVKEVEVKEGRDGMDWDEAVTTGAGDADADMDLDVEVKRESDLRNKGKSKAVGKSSVSPPSQLNRSSSSQRSLPLTIDRKVSAAEARLLLAKNKEVGRLRYSQSQSQSQSQSFDSILEDDSEEDLENMLEIIDVDEDEDASQTCVKGPFGKSVRLQRSVSSALPSTFPSILVPTATSLAASAIAQSASAVPSAPAPKLRQQNDVWEKRSAEQLRERQRREEERMRLAAEEKRREREARREARRMAAEAAAEADAAEAAAAAANGDGDGGREGGGMEGTGDDRDRVATKTNVRFKDGDDKNDVSDFDFERFLNDDDDALDGLAINSQDDAEAGEGAAGLRTAGVAAGSDTGETGETTALIDNVEPTMKLNADSLISTQENFEFDLPSISQDSFLGDLDDDEDPDRIATTQPSSGAVSPPWSPTQPDEHITASLTSSSSLEATLVLSEEKAASSPSIQSTIPTALTATAPLASTQNASRKPPKKGSLAYFFNKSKQKEQSQSEQSLSSQGNSTTEKQKSQQPAQFDDDLIGLLSGKFPTQEPSASQQPTSTNVSSTLPAATALLPRTLTATVRMDDDEDALLGLLSGKFEESGKEIDSNGNATMLLPTLPLASAIGGGSQTGIGTKRTGIVGRMKARSSAVAKSSGVDNDLAATVVGEVGADTGAGEMEDDIDGDDDDDEVPPGGSAIASAPVQRRRRMIVDEEEEEEGEVTRASPGKNKILGNQQMKVNKRRRMVLSDENDDDDNADSDEDEVFSRADDDVRRRSALSSGRNSDDDDDDEDDGDDLTESNSADTKSKTASPASTTSALMHLLRQQQKQQQVALPKSKFVEAEAEEEDDEFKGLGGPDLEEALALLAAGKDGADGNGEKPTLDAEMLKSLSEMDLNLDGMLPEVLQADMEGDVSKVGLEDVLALRREQDEKQDKQEIEALLKDVTSGALRKRGFGVAARASRRETTIGDKGADMLMNDDSDDDEAILQRIRSKLRRIAKPVKKDEDDDDEAPALRKLATNPETAAFAKCFDVSLDTQGFLSDSGEDDLDDTIKDIRARHPDSEDDDQSDNSDGEGSNTKPKSAKPLNADKNDDDEIDLDLESDDDDLENTKPPLKRSNSSSKGG
ncbi:hypothetical protein HK102_000815, partial [Quaeritorhiza haematococci]